jgi:hypothetical protein
MNPHQCEICGKEELIPFKCACCGGYFCAEHRLPESHNCPKVPDYAPANINEEKARLGQYKPSPSVSWIDESSNKKHKSIFSRIKKKIKEKTLTRHIKRKKLKNILFAIFLTVLLIYFLLSFNNPDFSHFHLNKASSSLQLAFGSGWVIVTYYIPIPIPLSSHSLGMAAIYFGVLIWPVVWGILGGKKGLVISILILLVAYLAIGEPERISTQDFSTRQQLSTFLQMDNTNQIQYTSDFECIDFSLTLIEHAKEAGYRIYFASTSDHAFCKAYIASEDTWLNIEPQTDEVWSTRK